MGSTTVNTTYTIPPQVVQPELTPGAQITQSPYYQAEIALRVRNTPQTSIRTITGSQQWVQGDYKIEIDTTSNTVAYYLPSYVNFVGSVTFVWIAGTYPALIVTTSSQTIDGNSLLLINQKYASVTVTGGSSGWWSSPNIVSETPITPYNIGASLATQTIDWSKSQNETLILINNSSLVFTNGSAGTNYTLELQQGLGYPHTVTWPSNVIFGQLGAPTLSTGSNNIDVLLFYYNGANYVYLGINQLAGSPPVTQGITPYNNGSHTSATINWNNSVNQKVTTTAISCAYTLTNPIAGYTYNLELLNNIGLGSPNPTFTPALQFGSVSSTSSSVTGQSDLYTLYYNGSKYVVLAHNTGYTP